MTAAGRVLVTGATGRVGREVVAELLRAGARVRALTRSPGTAGLPAAAEVVRGDLEDPASLAPALAGVERMYLFPVPETAREVVAMAEQAGVRRIVVLSGALAGQEEGDEAGYRPVEIAVEESALDWTFVRPGEFAANWLDHAPGVRDRREVRRPFTGAVGRPTHEADIAEVAAAALLGNGHTGRIYTFGGPQELTFAEQARIVGDAIGAEIRLLELTPEQTHEEWYAPEHGVDHAVIDWLLDLYGSTVGARGILPDAADVERVLGRPARTFARWASDHAEDFR
ncbi:nucleotide-diphosphate-sugar epimerase [Microtetraspora sp. NBRC 13810]|uniref:NAD(P)H-binding protein n=1 Tax=Microtetraspora sp. NBRC 13810 TaxID=3030990 RepID=UPI0024A4C3BB|nr:NAD(P)H-binding protein [Microtetraspora sp. NBRC 13810]GLW06995.1 nucleotide-diphosphate-sugar epimerase [Microtetraspora sp. NBRC 13810]